MNAGGYTEHRKGAAGETVSPLWVTEVTAKLGSWGGYFFFACRNKLMMPMTTRQNWNSSEYVSIRTASSRWRRQEAPSGDGGANRLPLLAALKDCSFLSLG